jgi:hypothetical protein
VVTQDLSLRTVQVLYSAPIPVGHRVEVQFFRESEEGAGAGEQQLLLETPIITDLDTGVVYASIAHYDRGGRLRQWLQTPFPERLEPYPHVFFGERLIGLVVACRVITDARAPGALDVMTQLKIEPEPVSVPPPSR